MLLVNERGEVVRVRVGPDDHGPAATTVTAVRPAAGDVLLPAEGHHAATTVAAADVQLNTIDEHRVTNSPLTRAAHQEFLHSFYGSDAEQAQGLADNAGGQPDQ